MEAKQSIHVKLKYRGLNPHFPKLPRGLIASAKK